MADNENDAVVANIRELLSRLHDHDLALTIGLINDDLSCDSVVIAEIHRESIATGQ